MYIFDIQEVSCTSEENKDSRFLQSAFWARFKCSQGWTCKRFFISVKTESSNFVTTVSVLIRTFGKGFFSLSYIPMAPKIEIASDSVHYFQFLDSLTQALKPFLPKNTLCVRYDPPIDFHTCQDRDAWVNVVRKSHSKLKKTKVDIQPPDTVILDLSKTSGELLNEMKPKWRYNIRLAEKKGVQITAVHADSPEFDNAVQLFYNLYKTTAQRDGIAIHRMMYYRQLLELSMEMQKKNPLIPTVTLYIAKHEEDYLAAIITLFCKREAVYLYGASSNIKRNLMPAYLLQWTAINDAKAYGSSIYDFYGIPPTEDTHHAMYGLYRFKTGFGGSIIHRPGSVDVVVHILYKPYILVENMRAFWHKKIKKLLAGR